ncbi:MAG: T9SS type A sorting domain-containing protein [Bacteroidota bacterium]|nr:T9SS type A sorting domain-containing protein [Bacteroidota bacterium]
MSGTHGNVSIDEGDTTLTYTPALNWYGIDIFSYRNTDGRGASNFALVVVTVTNVNHPQIYSIKDVPHDQGGKVSLNWQASSLDTNTSALTHYSIWRAIPQCSVQKSGIVTMSAISGDFKGTAYRVTSINDTTYFWEWIANQPAHKFAKYSYTASTLYDSMSTTNGKHYFLVSAHTNNPNVFYDSNVDSGYSIDNLSPLAPKGFAALFASGQVTMRWNANVESDLHSYVLFRGTSPANLVELGATSDTQYVDQSPISGNSYYAIRAMDIHENLSPFSNTIVTGVAGGDQQFPREYALNQNYPNPFNPSTTIKYALPQASQVSLGVYNTLGQRVALLIHGKQEAGYHEVSFNASGLTSGVYFYRLSVSPSATRDLVPTSRGEQAGDPSTSSGQSFVETKKLILMR